MKLTRPVVMAAGLALLLAPGEVEAAGPWWNYAWQCRRKVTIAPTKPTKLAGPDIAVVTMPTGGRISPGAVDVRVTTGRMTLMPHRVLMVGPGDQMKVALEIRDGVTDYFVYYGNPKAAAPEQGQGKELEIKRGVLMSTWEYPGGPTGDLAQITRIFSRSKALIGRRFIDRIFIGHNPFGPQQRLASTFEAYLICPASGSYIFSSSSRNASFLLIDDKLVVSNGGMHDPQRDIRRRGTVVLTAGLHKLTFHHVSARGAPVAVVAWRPPGAKAVGVIPPAAYAPIVRGVPGIMEEVGKLSVDFLPVHAGETFMRNRYYQRYTFEALAAVGNRRARNWQWDFGDGQKGTGLKAEHVYLRPGTYSVTLTAKVYAATLTRTNRIVVTRPWDRVIFNRLDRLKKHGNIVATYDFASLAPTHLAEAIMLFQRLGRRDMVISVGAAAARKKKLPATLGADILPAYADALVAAGRPAAAAAAMIKSESIIEDPATAAVVLVKAGRVLLDSLNEPQQAAIAFSRAISRYGVLTRSAAIRDARIGIGDTWRAIGDRGKALASYHTAGTGRIPRGRPMALARGDLARHVEDYIRRGNNAAAAEKLDEWARTFPADKLDGYWSLLRTRQLMAARQHVAAAREAEVLVGVSPTSHHAAALLMLAAHAHRKAGQADKASAALRRIISDYSESSLAAQAAVMLKSK